MKRINFTLFTILVLAIVFSCTKANLNYTQNGNWVHRSTFGGAGGTAIGVGYPASFVLNNIAYVGTGVNPASPSNKLVQFWSYTPGVLSSMELLTVLLQPAPGPRSLSFIGPARSNGIGFNTGGLGYVGTGLAMTAAPCMPISILIMQPRTRGPWPILSTMIRPAFPAMMRHLSVSTRWHT
jgi:hypothetical protein